MNSTISQMYTPMAYGGKIHIENDVILPDYCADIQRVVKAELVPKITAKNSFGDENGLNISIDGTALFKIIYLSDGSDRLHSTFFSETFSHSFKVQADKSSDPEQLFLHINLLPESVSCRPSATRRISIRADLNVQSDIRLNRSTEYLGDKDQSCEVKTYKFKACSMLGQGEADYSISEKINLPQELPPAEEILNCDMRYVCESLKIKDGKAIFTANALFTCFYASQDGNISFCQPIELSQIVDIPDALEAQDGEIRFTPTSLRCDIDVDNYGENRVIDLDFSYTAHALAFANMEFEAALDIFSPTNEITAEYGDFTSRSFVRSLCEKVPVTGSLKLKNPETKTLEDIRPAVTLRGWVVENGILSLDGRLNLKMIGACPGGYDGIEDNLDFCAKVKLDDVVSPQCDLSASVCEVDCVVAGNSIEVRADVVINGSVFAQAPIHCVKFLTVGEKKKPSPRPPMILYYPYRDETLWDIAKKYSLPQKLIMDFNHMESEKITDCVVKIPTV